MHLIEAAEGFIIFLFSMAVIQGQVTWGVTYSATEICALKGSTVEMSCTYPLEGNPEARVEQTMWFVRKSYNKPVDLRTDIEYSGRVQYRCYDDVCTLTIRNLKASDSAEYKFWFITNQHGWRNTGSPGVTLRVTDLQMEVTETKVSGAHMTVLKCQSSCLPSVSSFIWYKNGQKIQEGAPSYSGAIHPTDSYSCALKEHEDFPSPSMCVQSQSCNKVIYLERNICAIRGSSVAISCLYDSYGSITSKFWFSPERSHQWQSPSQPEDLNEDPQYAGRVQFDTWTYRKRYLTLTISDLTERDSAEYRFKFTAGRFEWRSSLPGTTLTVTDPDLQVAVTRSGLTCESNCQLPKQPTYIWYRNGMKSREGGSPYYSRSSNPADSFSCALKGHENFPAPSVCVSGQTCNRVTYTYRSICAPRGSSVNISCSYNSYGSITSELWFSPERRHQWQSPSQPEDLHGDSQYTGRVQVFETERGRSTLRITELRETDSAEYRFKFRTRSFTWGSNLAGTTLTVTALQVRVVNKKVFESSTYAVLKCHSSCTSAGRLSYAWFKNGKKIMKEESSSYSGQFDPGDNISCALKGHETHGSPLVYALKLPSVSASPSGKIMEGSSVTLTCSSDANTPANYIWHKKNGNLRLPQNEPDFVLHSIQPSDSGEYYCTAENILGWRRSQLIFIDVMYAPKLPSVSVSPSAEIVEGSSVTLTCSSDANPAAHYTWYKEDLQIFQGPNGSHHFTSISSEDRGSYTCKSENQHGQSDSKSVYIDVKYAPKLPSASVSPSAEIVEGSSVNLTCSSDANPAANYTWYKEDEDSPKASGQIFTITDFRAEHSGNYYCEARNTEGHHNSTLHLIVVAGAWKAAAAGTTFLVLAVVLFPLFILIRRKRASKHSPDPGERPDNRGEHALAQRQPDDRQDDLHYASVQYFRNHTDALYSNIRTAGNETAEYTAVRFDQRNNFMRNQQLVEEASDPVYSTVNK